MAEARFFIDQLRQALAQRGKRVYPERSSDPRPPTPSAVLVPLFEREKGYHLLFTLRTHLVEHHKGQISFPGGAAHHGDESPLATALRESEEEIGLSPGDVAALGELEGRVTSTNFLVSPFVGLIPYPYPFRLNRLEVEELIEVPLAHLLDPRYSWQDSRPGGEVGYFYNHNGRVIWGTTGWIVKQLLDLISGEGLLVP